MASPKDLPVSQDRFVQDSPTISATTIDWPGGRKACRFLKTRPGAEPVLQYDRPGAIIDVDTGTIFGTDLAVMLKYDYEARIIDACNGNATTQKYNYTFEMKGNADLSRKRWWDSIKWKTSAGACG